MVCMASLSSSSTQADAVAQYKNNAAYATDGSTSMAKDFIEACRVLLLELPASMSENSISLQHNTALLQEEIRKAERWLAQRTQGGSVRFHDFRDLRS